MACKALITILSRLSGPIPAVISMLHGKSCTMISLRYISHLKNQHFLHHILMRNFATNHTAIIMQRTFEVMVSFCIMEHGYVIWTIKPVFYCYHIWFIMLAFHHFLSKSNGTLRGMYIPTKKHSQLVRTYYRDFCKTHYVGSNLLQHGWSFLHRGKQIFYGL